MLIFPRLLSRSSISHTIRTYDMPTMRIRRDWPGESRLGQLAMDLASSVSVPLRTCLAERERNSPEHSSLQAAININLDALVHDLHESGVVLMADNEWVRISGLACSTGRL